MNLTTVEIAEKLEQVTSETILTDNTYCLVKELTLRQLYRQKLRLSRKLITDLAHIITVNILLYLNTVYPRNFKVTNWIKFIHNKAYKTSTAIYDIYGNEKPEIIDFEDVLDEEEFISRFFYNQLTPYYELDEFECTEGLNNIGLMLPRITENLIRYSKNYEHYKEIYYSVIFSFFLNREIFLFPLKEYEKNYVRNLVNIIKQSFPSYMKNNMIDGNSLLNQYLTDLRILMQFERIDNEQSR